MGSMWANQNKGLVNLLNTSERVIKKMTGFLNLAITIGSRKADGWLLTNIVRPKRVLLGLT